MTNTTREFHIAHYLVAWAVHLFTASAAFIGILTLIKIFQQQYIHALWFMGVAVVIDAVDGSLARLVKVKKVLPRIDGTLLDNIVDYLNYVITPCVFLYIKSDMLPVNLVFPIIFLVTITSAYQFCQADAKTPDHFFKGFPCYWNIVLFYMFILDTSMWVNTFLLLLLSVLIFVPIKYVYPSRLDYLTESKWLKVVMHGCSILFGISAVFILLSYPEVDPMWLSISLAYVALYLALSFYRTYSPMIKAKIAANRQQSGK